MEREHPHYAPCSSGPSHSSVVAPAAVLLHSQASFVFSPSSCAEPTAIMERGHGQIPLLSAANPESQCASISREENTQLSSTTSQGYVLPEGKIMPNTVFVGGIDIRMDETEIRSFFARYGTVKEVKIITDRTGVSKGYGFVSFLDNVDVQKIVEFHSVWSNQNAETYMPPPAMMSPVTQYVQAYPYGSQAVLIQQQVPVGYQPAYNYQVMLGTAAARNPLTSSPSPQQCLLYVSLALLGPVAPSGG
ncbi:Deleted in azoospermia-like protein [Chelonia mydas]|uniref:Deleted in azoospermia-like protein n=1 Tax=Chelonia mydas TaxID=8469 RepID=M7BVU7_CHEMY|nr:Deleted in azoospermia-like protein [Chelonia mydas]